MADADLGHNQNEQSDRESLYADSPANGYFQRRDHPQETYIQNPQVTQSGSAAKAQEAAEDCHDARSIAESDASSIRSSWSDETASLLVQDAGPAPPDYAAATANRASEVAPYNAAGSSNSSHTSQAPQPTPIAYGTVEPPAAPAAPSPPSEPAAPTATEQQSSQDPGLHWPFGGQSPFGPNFPFGSNGGQFGPNGPLSPHSTLAQQTYKASQAGHQQNMSDNRVTEADEETGLLSRKRKWRSGNKGQQFRRCCKPIFCCALFLGVVAVVLIMLVAKGLRNRDGDGDDDRRNHDQPPNLSPNSTGPIRHPDTRFCKFSSYSETASFTFDKPVNFSFVEMLEQKYPFNGGITGNLWILPAPADQENDVVVWVSYATTSPFHVTQIKWSSWDEEALELEFPEVKPQTTMMIDRACMSLQVSIYVRRDSGVKDFNIASANLDIHSDANLFDRDATQLGTTSRGLALPGVSSFSAIAGKVKLPYWSSRETIIDAISGSVTGNYALRDLLSIHTRSGKIDISVDPQAADQHLPVPPVFRSVSISGSTNVIFPGIAASIPIRGYVSSVETRSGRIVGNYLLGTSATFSTTSGNIGVSVLPITTERFPPTILRTDAISGDTSLSLLSPYENPGEPIRLLKATHKSISGKLDLDYAFEWEGKLDGHTMSGNIKVRGDQLRSTPVGYLPASKHIVAYKGSGSSLVDCGTISGDIRFRARDD